MGWPRDKSTLNFLYKVLIYSTIVSNGMHVSSKENGKTHEPVLVKCSCTRWLFQALTEGAPDRHCSIFHYRTPDVL